MDTVTIFYYPLLTRFVKTLNKILFKPLQKQGLCNTGLFVNLIDYGKFTNIIKGSRSSSSCNTK